MIGVEENDGEITSIAVNGETLDSDDGELWFLPKGLVAGLNRLAVSEEVANLNEYLKSLRVVFPAACGEFVIPAPYQVRDKLQPESRRPDWIPHQVRNDRI